MSKRKQSPREMLLTSLLLVLIALVGITAATVAWFTIADRAKVQMMGLQLFTDANLRFDLDSHATFEEYIKTLSFEDIAARVQTDQGYDMHEVPLEPVTTSDYSNFSYEKGQSVSQTGGAYWEFTLHFMATEDMTVSLNPENSGGEDKDGTAIESKNDELIDAMRISFTSGDETWVYDPGMGDTVTRQGNTTTFGLGATRSRNSAMFSLQKETDLPVQVHIWLEGTDPACTNSVGASDYTIRLRFSGETLEEQQKNNSLQD